MDRINDERNAMVYDAYMAGGVSQKEVGARFGLAPTTVCKILGAERRRRSGAPDLRKRTVRETKAMMQELGIEITQKNVDACLNMSRQRMHIHAGFLRDAKNLRDFGEPVNVPCVRVCF